jgi:16S rRNA (adenine1518-N6/adenine1519-N6)-dimethyltransferase
MQMRPAPKKRLGQNFLRDGHARQRIIAACDFSSDDIVIEIGPGQGALTSLIAPRVKKVYAVELDRSLAAGLQEKYPQPGNISIIPGDILRFDFTAIPEFGSVKLKVFGNIPYYITSPILERLVGLRSAIDVIFLTVQKEFARRICAVPGGKEYGSFSCYVQYYTRPEILFDIKKNSFYPVPRVDSSFIRLAVRKHPAVSVPDEQRLFTVIRHAFQQRRKTIRNSLRDIVSKDDLDVFFARSRLDPNTRPEKLTLQDFAVLAGCP